jgi:signal transduction histidine kinase
MSDPAVADGGMGLRIMRQRAKLIGAALDIVSIPDKGTIISCCLPFSVEDVRVARRA